MIKQKKIRRKIFLTKKSSFVELVKLVALHIIDYSIIRNFYNISTFFLITKYLGIVVFFKDFLEYLVSLSKSGRL
ncbi:MAG: hypothetical protein CFH34_00852 [Alphaproteobacteria bacterium MarineAlpha9_Bin4]|nr:MAG: hypothetical protein CFH34_00852 [Alphaproteobacteria bacterium MarineAlpha9_Bin4]